MKSLMKRPKKVQFMFCALACTAAVVLLQFIEQVTGSNFGVSTVFWIGLLCAGAFGIATYFHTKKETDTLDDENGYHVDKESERD